MEVGCFTVFATNWWMLAEWLLSDLEVIWDKFFALESSLSSSHFLQYYVIVHLYCSSLTLRYCWGPMTRMRFVGRKLLSRMEVLQTPFLLLIVAADGRKTVGSFLELWISFSEFSQVEFELVYSLLHLLPLFLLPRGASFYILTRWTDDFSCIIGFNEGFLLISMWNASILLLGGVVRGVKRDKHPLNDHAMHLRVLEVRCEASW